jgi:hypothetical protein
MKVKIKTAHGYLSFQPDGRLEYRANAGAWEEIDIEGLTLVPVGPTPTPGPTPSPQPPPAEQPPFPAFPAQPYVAQIKDWLQSQGKDLSGPCGAFLITSWVAWGLRASGAGTLYKPSGNHCRERATDVVLFQSEGGAIVDVLGDGGNANVPTWQRSNPGEVTLDRWRAPEYPG